jgi:glycerol-3-phosphate dehydrogenase
VTEHYDVVIAGGGIHGVGVAQAAACAGHSVLLLEKTGLAAGSSSRSSKLVHGGLRYLEGYDFGLVRESLHERTLLLKIAPELVKLRSFHIPIYPDTSRRPLTLRAGLILYALLGGLHRGSSFRKLQRSEWDRLDGLETQQLQAVFRYHDAQTNDIELTRAVMQSAIRLGATLACPAEFQSAQITPDYVAVQYRQNGVDSECTAAVLVNAGGAWVGSLDARIDPAPEAVPVELVQGAHLVLEGKLNAGCYYMEAPQDRRAIFLLPWGDHCMLGTTETPYTGDPAAVAPLEQEQNYLLEAIRHYFPDRSTRVLDRFAGLRVLPASGGAMFSRSRETMLPVDNPRRPRLVSIYGGKLTGYRAAAEKVMHLLARSLPEREVIANTAEVRLTPVD